MYKLKNIGLLLGLFLFVLVLFLPAPDGLSKEGMSLIATTVLMVTWWISEAIPIYITAFIPVVLFPLMGIMSSSATSATYGHNYVLMLLGAFILAKGIEKQNLHKRIALFIIQLLGTNQRNIILGFMIATAFLSMWITNMAVVLIMLPIASSLLQNETEYQKRFGLALLLGIAYAASVGGTGTLIGTPPNLVFAGMASTLDTGIPPIDFLSWMKIGLPVVFLFIPLVWFYLIRFYNIKKQQQFDQNVFYDQMRSTGKLSKGELRVFIIFSLTALGWIFRRDMEFGEFTLSGWSTILGVGEYVHDSTVALFGAILLFMVHDGKNKRLMNWSTAKTIPWGVAMFLGGGLALGLGFKETGLASWLGQHLSTLVELPVLLMVFLVVLLLIFITEINSNTATATIFLPIIAALALATNLNPFVIMIPATFACSFAFMLPSGTGTNTVIFASEKISIQQMARAGFWLNIISAVLLTVFLYYWIPFILI